MHVIDNSSRGADGVRLADFDRDGLRDIVTGWEEGGVIRVYQNPGPAKADSPWPKVTVGKVKSPEDAVFVDLDGDGALDVVSCCEGKTKTVYVHWAPSDPSKYLDSKAWETTPVPGHKRSHGLDVRKYLLTSTKRMDMDLYVGAKGANACVGWLESPKDPRKLEAWKFHSIEKAGWIMSLRMAKLKNDRHLLVSDRKGPNRGVYFLSREDDKEVSWKRIDLMKGELEYMFLDFAASSSDESKSGGVVSVATRNKKSVRIRIDDDLKVIQRSDVPNPHGIPNGKAVAGRRYRPGWKT